jgi:hypothetical protein
LAPLLTNKIFTELTIMLKIILKLLNKFFENFKMKTEKILVWVGGWLNALPIYSIVKKFK